MTRYRIAICDDEEDVRSLFHDWVSKAKYDVDVKEYTRRTVEKYITESIKVSDGYYLDKDSVVYGINPYTGMTYLHYTEVRLKDGKKQEQKAPSVQQILDERGYWEVKAG